MADMMKKVPVREQDAKERACNFEEVCLGYNADEAVAEAQRCLNCKNAHCVTGMSGFHQYSRLRGKGKRGRFCSCLSGYQRIQRTSRCLWSCLPAGKPV